MTVLALDSVSKAFGAVRAVDDVGFAVEAGSVFGLIGPNGAGKTTLVNLVTAYLRPDRGRIVFRDRSIVGASPHRLARRGVARTYQNLRLFEDSSVLENILIGRHLSFGGHPWQLLSRRHGEERQERRAAAELAERLGLGAVLGDDVSGLSYGLRRRVEIARALATEPRLLLLDEPTAGMTRSESDDIGVLVRHLCDQEMTVLLVEHNVRLVSAVCDRVAVLDWGRLIALDTPERIWSNPQVRGAYLGTRKTA